MAFVLSVRPQRVPAVSTTTGRRGKSAIGHRGVDARVGFATPRQNWMLQRKCACGNHPRAGGECEECSKNNPLGLQTKLEVNEPGDIYEQEANRIADRVMATPAHHAIRSAPPRIQRFSGQSNGQAETAPASVDRALAGAGRPLEPELRQDMEQHFGQDLSRVRVHTDAASEQSAGNVKAHAYTVGHSIVFGAGRFAPGTNEGRWLIAHELTHVVQQSGVGNRAAAMLVQRTPAEPSISGLQQELEEVLEELAANRGAGADLVEQELGNKPASPGKIEAGLRGVEKRGGPHAETAKQIRKELERLGRRAAGIRRAITRARGRTLGSSMTVPPKTKTPRKTKSPPSTKAPLKPAVTETSFKPSAAIESEKPPTTGKAPKPPTGFRARVGSVKAGFGAGLKGAVSAPNIASMIPGVILAIADRQAAKEAIRTIQIKFLKEGFAKGVAAGVMRWSEQEVASSLKNHVSETRIRGLEDPAGFLKRGDIFKIAEAYENYAVDLGYQFSSSKTKEWKNDILDKGFSYLSATGYLSGREPEAYYFEYEFINNLAWAIRSITNPIADEAIERAEQAREARKRREEDQRRKELKESGCAGFKC